MVNKQKTFNSNVSLATSFCYSEAKQHHTHYTDYVIY